jgi:hypothetical protein
MAKRRRKSRGFFESITFIIKGTEASIVELLVTIGPWLTPLTPASMTYKHVVGTLGFHQVWGWTTAIAVEILGLASGHTLAKYYRHNKMNRAQKDKLPVWPIIVTFMFYLAVVITINLALEWDAATWPERVSLFGLILLSVPAIVIVSTRAQHAQILFEKDRRYTEDVDEQPQPVVVRPRPVVISNNGGGKQEVEQYLIENEISPHQVGRGGVITPGELAEILSINPSTVRTACHRLRNEE